MFELLRIYLLVFYQGAILPNLQHQHQQEQEQQNQLKNQLQQQQQQVVFSIVLKKVNLKFLADGNEHIKCYLDPEYGSQLSCNGTYCTTITFSSPDEDDQILYGCEDLSDVWGM